MKAIILTVQSNGSGGWRLGINCSDSKNIFRCRKVKVLLYLPKIDIIECYTACGNPCDKDQKWIRLNSKTGSPFRKKGYDLNKKELSNWISKNYKNDKKRRPRKLAFNLSKKLDVFHLHFKFEEI